MPTLHVKQGSALELQQIADSLARSKKVVVVTGAGISTNCGIPDFRSEDGLYSLIQAQYNESLKNPPWEQFNTFEIDDRPKKKRKTWYYEIVAPDGRVVDVIDEDVKPLDSTLSQEIEPGPTEQEKIRLSSPSRSTNTTSLNSRASSPTAQSSESSLLSSCPSPIIEPQGIEKEVARPSSHSRSTVTASSDSRASSPSAQSSELSSLSSCPSTPEPVTAAEEASQPSDPNHSPRRSTRIHPEQILPLATSQEDSFTKLITQNSDTPPLPTLTLPQEDSICSSSTQSTEPPTNTQSSQSSRSLPNLKGRDLFDSMVWSDPFTTSVFYMFIASLRQKVLEVKDTSETHKFIRVLRDGGRLARNYCQNIDMLEEREGLSQDLSLGPGTRSKQLDSNRGCECVPLHGTLARLRCGVCQKPSDWGLEQREQTILGGQGPDCPHCQEFHTRRTSNNRRGTAIGRLRPDIVLYGEEHPHANLISDIVTNDLGLALDVLLIMGTSLRVHGLKTMVKEFAKAVHSRGGTVVFVNRTKPSESVWGDVIDYWVEMDCDQWVRDLKERRSDIWSPRSSMIEAPIRRQQLAVESKQGSKKRSQALRDDKINGVFVTFRILDLLKNAEDAKGRQSARLDYWPSAARLSNASAIQVQSKPVSKLPPQKKIAVPPLKRKSMSKPAREHSKPAKGNSKPIKLPPLPSNHKEYHEYHASWVSSAWENLRRQAPGLPAAPPIPQELRQPFEKFKGNLPPYLVPFSFNAVNHFPNLVTAKEKPTLGEMNMDLAHLPPKGFTIPAHTPKNAKTVITRAINHNYGTRASRRFSNAETIVVDNGNSSTPPAVPSEAEDTIVVDDPLTPSSERIKRHCSIGNIVSSPEEGSGEEIWHDAPELPDVMT